MINWNRNDADGLGGESPDARYTIDGMSEGYTLTIEFIPGWNSSLLQELSEIIEEHMNTNDTREVYFSEEEVE